MPAIRRKFHRRTGCGAIAQKQADGGAGNRISISPGVIMLLAVVILIPGTFAIWKLGPGKIKAQSSKMESHASDNVGDVVDRALQSYLSQHGQFDSMIAHSTPTCLRFILSSVRCPGRCAVDYFIWQTTEGGDGRAI